MSLTGKIEIVDVNPDNVAETGFFCLRSRPKSRGYQQKLRWLEERFGEGLKIKLATGGGRGFIEYIPGEYAWRPVRAGGYMFIHCLWVTGQAQGKGCATALLNECLKDAEGSDMAGVAVVTSTGMWLVGKEFFLKHGFESVDRAPPSFELMVRKFLDAPSPSFTRDWQSRTKSFGDGFTVIYTGQCPFTDYGVEVVREVATELGREFRVVELGSCSDVREQAPSAYGVFSVVYNGKLLDYHPLSRAQLLKRLEKAQQG